MADESYRRLDRLSYWAAGLILIAVFIINIALWLRLRGINDHLAAISAQLGEVDTLLRSRAGG